MKFLNNLIVVLMFTSIASIWSCKTYGDEHASDEKSDLKPSVSMLITNRVLDSLKQVYAPDKRVALFDISSRIHDHAYILSGETNLEDAHLALTQILEGQEWVDSIQVLPVGLFREKPYGIINVSTCNIRAEARHSSELSTQAILGTPIKIYKQQGSWYYIQTPDGYLGWLNEGTFIHISKEEFETFKQQQKCVFLSDMGKVFVSSSLAGASIMDLSMGNLLTCLGQEGVATKVELPDGRLGYLPSKDISTWEQWSKKADEPRSAVIQTAYSLLGRPYLWGGTSSKGMDCSGYTKTVFFAHHMILPRDASQQVNTGDLITRDVKELDKVQPGDLLFFGRKEKDRERVTHVGIYLGDDRMIHAGDGRVQIQSLNPSHDDYVAKRRNSFLSAKDLLSQKGNNGVQLVSSSDWYQ